MLKPNQLYRLTIKTPQGTYTYQFITQAYPMYSSYEQLLADTGLRADILNIVDGLRFLYQASLLCNDLIEYHGSQVPASPNFVMRQYVRYRAARDVIMSGLRQATYSGRGVVKQRLADLHIEHRPQPLMVELQATLRNLEKELAYWEARLTGKPPVASAVRAGRSYPYPLPPRL